LPFQTVFYGQQADNLQQKEFRESSRSDIIHFSIELSLPLLLLLLQQKTTERNESGMRNNEKPCTAAKHFNFMPRMARVQLDEAARCIDIAIWCNFKHKWCRICMLHRLHQRLNVQHSRFAKV